MGIWHAPALVLTEGCRRLVASPLYAGCWLMATLFMNHFSNKAAGVVWEIPGRSGGVAGGTLGCLGVTGDPCGYLWGSLGTFGDSCGTSCGRWGSWAVPEDSLEVSLATLGGAWGCLGGSWGVLCGPYRRFLGVPCGVPNRLGFQFRFWVFPGCVSIC